MSTIINTKGDVKRVTKETERLDAIEQKKLQQRLKHEQIRRNNEEKGLYKKTIVDSYISIFAENYGDSFDYNSLIQALTFNFKENADGSITPSFVMNTNTVNFKSDVEAQGHQFNENSYSDFITNEDTISGKSLDAYQFDNIEEYDAYLEGDTMYDDLIELDGMFVPTTVNARYGTFNRINKLLGYTPPEESSAQAQKKAITV